MNFKDLWLPKQTSQVESGSPLDVTWECKNLNHFPIVLTSTRNQENLDWSRFIIQPGEYCHLPHRHYMIFDYENPDSGRKITIEQNFGDKRVTKCPFDVRRGNTLEKHTKIKATPIR